MQRVGANKPCISSNFAVFCSGFCWIGRVVWTRFQRLQMLRCAVGGDAGGSTYVKVTLADWLMRERRSFTQRRTDMLCYPTSSRSLVKYCNTTLLVQEQWVCGVVVLWEDQCLQDIVMYDTRSRLCEVLLYCQKKNRVCRPPALPCLPSWPSRQEAGGSAGDDDRGHPVGQTRQMWQQTNTNTFEMKIQSKMHIEIHTQIMYTAILPKKTNVCSWKTQMYFHSAPLNFAQPLSLSPSQHF